MDGIKSQSIEGQITLENNQISSIYSTNGYFLKGSFYTDDSIISAKDLNNTLQEHDDYIVIEAEAFMRNNRMKKSFKPFLIITEFGKLSFDKIKEIMNFSGIGFPISGVAIYSNLLVINNRRWTMLEHLIKVL